MTFLIKLTVLLSALLCVLAAKLPANIKRCKSMDNDCIKKSVQEALTNLKDGYPDLELPPIDPLLIPEMSVEGGHIVQLVQNYENMQVCGLSETKINDVVLDLVKGILVFDVQIPVIDLNATYSVKGKLMVMDVYGKGNSLIRLEKNLAKLKMSLETFTKNNEKYLKVTNPELVLECQHAVFQFDNLFDGNKLLGENINKVLNDNWREILDELKPSYVKGLGISVMDHINKIFIKVPMKELFLD